MEEHIFPKVFPYFFPLAVFTLRAIWYIRYILKTDLNLMIPDVVVWQLMDRVKQIRIPHPSFRLQKIRPYVRCPPFRKYMSPKNTTKIPLRFRIYSCFSAPLLVYFPHFRYNISRSTATRDEQGEQSSYAIMPEIQNLLCFAEDVHNMY